MKLQKKVWLFSISVSLLFPCCLSQAQESKGWDKTVRVADYLEPAIPHPEQQQAALEKLRQFEAKTGRKPNILILPAAISKKPLPKSIPCTKSS